MEKEAATWRRRLVLGTIFALPVAILSMGGMLPGLEDIMRGPLVVGALPLGWIVQAVLAAVVQVRVLLSAGALKVDLHVSFFVLPEGALAVVEGLATWLLFLLTYCTFGYHCFAGWC